MKQLTKDFLLYIFMVAIALAGMFASPSHAFEKDKIGHFVVGVGVGALTTFKTDFNTGVAVSCGLGAAKELYDHAHPKTHSVEFADFAATCIGGIISSYGVEKLKLQVNQDKVVLRYQVRF